MASPLKFAAIALSLLVSQALVGQDSNSAIEQSRLFQKIAPPTASSITTDGTALPGDGIASDDGSFGAQQMLKAQEKTREFEVSGAASVFFTSNVALTRRDTMDDIFFVADAAVGWTHRINNEFQLQLGTRASIFRYNETSALDFQSVGAGIGAIWTPASAWGIGVIARYDFIELIDRHSNELLQDHEFSLAIQKIVALGRSHGLSFALLASADISDPFAEQRDQIGAAIGYHLQLARNFGMDLNYRHAWYFYNSGERTDLNQVISLGLHYQLAKWATLEAFVSGATNYSTESVFKYDVFNTGGGVGLTVRF